MDFFSSFQFLVALPNASTFIDVVNFSEREIKGGGEDGWAIWRSEFQAPSGGLDRGSEVTVFGAGLEPISRELVLILLALCDAVAGFASIIVRSDASPTRFIEDHR